MDNPGQPEQESTPAGSETRTAPDAQQDGATQTVSLSTAQAAQQLEVDSRTVRRYISEGIRTAGGVTLRLKARLVRSNRGQEWQIYQTDLEQFRSERDRATTEGGLATRGEESAALATSVQIISEELERRSVALSEAQTTIERLAREAGQYAGRNEVLERELEALRKRVAELEQERKQWEQKSKKSYRIRLLPFTED